MVTMLDSTQLGKELWIAESENGSSELRLFGKRPYFLTMVATSYGRELERGYIISPLIPQFMGAKHRIIQNGFDAHSYENIKIFALISLQDNVAFKAYKRRKGVVGVQLLRLDHADQARTWRIPDDKFKELVNIIGNWSWAHIRYY